MVCTACGTPVAAGVNFCPRCGAQMAAPAPVVEPPVYAAAGYPPPAYANPYMPRPRVQGNLQTLAILWFVYAGYRVLKVLAAMFFVKAFALGGFGGEGWPLGHHFRAAHPDWVGALLPVIAVGVAVSTGLAIFVGWSLLNRKPWGRTLGIIAAVLALFSPFMGTALGIFTLWVLAPTASGMEWEAIADRS